MATPTHFLDMPRLTPAGRALLPQMADKARAILMDACPPQSDRQGIVGDLAAADATCASFEEFAAKLIGVAISPRLDGTDEAFYQVMCALEQAGIFSPIEMQILERYTPSAFKKNWGAHYPSEIRAEAFADFFNGRNEEGTMGENLPHIAVRRAWERLFDCFSALRTLGNRAGLQHAGDLFVPAYCGFAQRELSATMPGEVIRPGLNDNKRN